MISVAVALLSEKLCISTSSVTTSSIEQNTEWPIDELKRVIQLISPLPAPFCTVAQSNTGWMLCE